MVDYIKIKQPNLFCKECFKNAERFIKDAKELMKEKSYAHSIALSLFAFEEISKARLVAKKGKYGEVYFTEKEYKDSIKSHKEKTISECDNMPYDWIKNNLSNIKSEKELFKKLDNKKTKKELESIDKNSKFILFMHGIREKLLYVDVQKGKVFSPLSLVKRKYALKTIKIVENKLKDQRKTTLIPRGKTNYRFTNSFTT